MSKSPVNANRVLFVVRKMFNIAELLGLRPDGSNPCRHIPKYPERGRTRLITEAEVRKLGKAYLANPMASLLTYHRVCLLQPKSHVHFTVHLGRDLKLIASFFRLPDTRV
ncbi:hypothetical protein QBC99_005956 [Beijerinckia sp. GAS462]|nr:hypothetical protein [Beijerinckia sp. GAS462]